MPDAPVPPVAQAIPTHHTIHGETRVDPYRWLHEKESADTRAYLEAENAYADAVLADTDALRDTVYAEMLGRIQETDLSVPYPMGGFTYYTRTEQGKQYPIHCRKAVGSDAEQVLLDVNQLAEGEKFLSVGTMAVSDNGRLLAYTTDRTGFREYTLRVKDLDTGELLPDTIEKVGSVAWAADNRTLFHTAEDAAKRPDRVLRHTLGSTDPDPVVIAEPDALYRVFLYRSRDRKVIFVGSASSTTTEVHAIPADAPESAPALLLARSEGHEYYPEHREGLYYLRTNRGAVNFRIVAASVDDVSEEHWSEVLAHDPGTMLEDMDLFRDHLVVTELSGGLPRLRIVSFATGEDHCVTFPEPTYMAGLETNREWDTRVLRFRYASLVTPASVFSYDMETRDRTLLKETPVLGGYDRGVYVSEYVHAVAADGTRVPISLVRHRDTPTDGTAPCLLYGYGSYGIVMPAGFNPSRLSLLDRGFVYAIAHIRGGGEMGKPWHDDGKLGKKMNTFTDFIACADHLVSEGYADRG
ncbi:MAG: S9 family peptidase, partial [Armatimonadota bacterium]